MSKEDPTLTIDNEVFLIKDLSDANKISAQILSEIEREVVSLKKRVLVLKAAEKSIIKDLKADLVK
tara:strand:+ start:2921 stop:3118 length:198 start_codon:yes stop_codon:yes gene_type:complete